MLVALVALGCSQKSVPTSSTAASDASSPTVASEGSEELLTLIREASPIGQMPMHTLAEKRAFIAAGHDIVTRARGLLSDEQKCRQMNDSGIAAAKPFTLMRLFYLGADVATADGRPQDAAELCLDLTRLGTVIANSAGFEDYDIGIGCHNIAVDRLAPLCKVLDEATCIHTMHVLDRESSKLDHAALVEQRGTAAVTRERDNGMSDAGAAANSKLLALQSQGYHKREMVCRTLGDLCRVKLALRVYYLQQGRFPQSLEDLTRNKILERLPKDYWCETGFVYRLRGDDYLLYSIGPDRRDHGGKQTDRNDLFRGVAGDLVL
jgi:hypothetical protein